MSIPASGALRAAGALPAPALFPVRAFLPLSTPGMVERLYVVAALSIALAVPFLVGGQPQGAQSLNPVKALERISIEGDAVKQLIFSVLYGGAAILVMWRMPLRLLLLIGTPLLSLTVWCFASASWADDPDVSVRRCAALAGTVLLGGYLALRFQVRDFLRLMRYVIAIVLVGSLLVALLWPASGLDYEGRLRGVFAHKNALSGFCTVALLIICARLFEFDYRGLLGAATDAVLAVLSVAAMLMAHSSGAVPALLVGLPLLVVTRMLRTADRGVLALLPVVLCVAAAAAIIADDYLASITALLGRDSDISGRTLIWQFAGKMFLDRFWAGYGYGTFWEGFNSPGGAFWSIFHIGAPHSHNGYLQLALDAGAVGIALFAAAIVVLVFRLAFLVRHGPEPLVGWAAAFLGLFLATNLVETRLWIGNQIDTVLLVYIATYVNLTLKSLPVQCRYGTAAWRHTETAW